jgi:hypothetical protein
MGSAEQKLVIPELPRRWFVGVTGCVVVSVVFWRWIQEAQVLTLALSVTFLLLSSITLLLGPAVARRPAAISLCLIIWFCFLGFYYPGGLRSGLSVGDLIYPRIRSIPGGRALLILSSIVALWYPLLAIHMAFGPPLGPESTTRYRRLLTLFAVLAFLGCSDLLFLGRGKPFDYRRAQFHPFLTYAALDTYAYDHATEGVVKDSRGTEFSQQKPDGVTRIVLTGASTMWGARLDYGQSPPRVLARILEAMYPDRKFEVLTVALPGKYQLNELIDATVTLPHWSPDLVVSFNGFNEIWYGELEDRYEGMPYIAPAAELALTVRPLTALGYANTFFGASLWKRRLEKNPQPLHSTRAPVAYEPPRYYAYLRRTARSLREMGIPYVHAFTPNIHELPSHRELPLSPKDADTNVRERRGKSTAIVREERQFVYDVMVPLLGSNQDEVFFDDCHLTASGVELVMNDIARRIPDWIARKPVAPVK